MRGSDEYDKNEPAATDGPPESVPEVEEARIGTMMGKYRIVGVLGRGGMGVVYEAEDPIIKRKVAIKILPKALSTDREALGRFMIEAQAAGKLHHTNTVAVYDVDQRDGVYYIVMELVRGRSADDILHERGKIEWSEATRIIADSCKGLGAAHAAGLIHRDIKPSNLMITIDGVAKLADFGLAKLTDGSGKSLTSIGSTVGTPQYMSPEQCRAMKLDARSDLYSLGATFFALLTGSSPFRRAGTTPKIMYAHCNEPVPDPREQVPTVPGGCSAIIRKAMAKDPEDRYQSAEEMIAALESSLTAPLSETGWTALVEAGTKPKAPKAPSGATPRPVSPHSRTAVSAGSSMPIVLAVLALLLVGGGVGGYFAFFRHTPEPEPVPKPVDKKIEDPNKPYRGPVYDIRLTAGRVGLLVSVAPGNTAARDNIRAELLDFLAAVERDKVPAEFTLVMPSPTGQPADVFAGKATSADDIQQARRWMVKDRPEAGDLMAASRAVFAAGIRELLIVTDARLGGDVVDEIGTLARDKNVRIFGVSLGSDAAEVDLGALVENDKTRYRQKKVK